MLFLSSLGVHAGEELFNHLIMMLGVWGAKTRKSTDVICLVFCLRYPSDADKHLLSRQTGLSRNQVHFIDLFTSTDSWYLLKEITPSILLVFHFDSLFYDFGPNIWTPLHAPLHHHLSYIVILFYQRKKKLHAFH